MKEMSLKKVVLCAIAAVTALFTLIALAYPLAQTSIFTLKLVERGFTTLDFSSGLLGDSLCGLVGTFSWIQLLASIMFLTVNMVAMFRFNQKTANKWAMATVITCLILNVFYFIIGVSLVADAEAYTTLSYVALIISVLFTTAYFVCKKVIKEDATLRKKSKESAEHKREVRQEADSVDLLVKYKKLLDEGVITQDEFDEKKKDLL